MEFNLYDLQYVVLPGRLSGANPPVQVYNQVYGFWKKIWSRALEKQNLPPLDQDEFLRQDYACALLYKNEVVASHLYSIFDFRSELTWDCNYFSPLEKELKTVCSNEEIESILTQEYLAVSPAMRKQKSMISLPEIVVGLGTNMMFATGSGSTGGTVREDAPSVDRIGHEIGCQILDTTIDRYGINHKFFIVHKDKVKYAGTQETHKAIDVLWNRRIDYTHLSNVRPITVAA